MQKAARLIRSRWDAWQSSPGHPQALQFWQHLLQASPEDPLAELLTLSPESIGPLYEALLPDARSQGKFYTPELLVDYLVQRTLGHLLNGARQRIDSALARRDLAEAVQVVTEIRDLRIVDPSCGCGVFLLAALRQLHAFFAGLPTPLVHLKPDAIKILDQLHGVDIDDTAVLLAKWSLAQSANRLDGATTPGAPEVPHIHGADALAFPWASGTFDVVLGNPPYLTEVRNQAQTFRRLREASTDGTAYYRAKMDLCDAFVYLGWELLREAGSLGYVLPEYWLQRNSARPLREHLWAQAEIREIHTFGNRKVFRSAPGHHTSLLILSRLTPGGGKSQSRPCLLGNGDLSVPGAGRVRLDSPTGRLLLGEAPVMDILEKFAQLPPLLESREIQQGIVFPQTRLRPGEWRRLAETRRQEVPPDTGIFVLTADECEALALTPEESRHLKPFYEPGSFRPFEGFPPASEPLWMIYADRQLKAAMAERPGDYPNLVAHLLRFEPVLTSSHKPFGLHRARQPEWFECSGRVLGLRQTFQPAFAAVDIPAYVGEGFYSLLPRSGMLPDYAVGLLNSSTAWFWFYHQKRKGHRLQVDKDVLLAFPAPPEPDPERVRQVIALSRNLARGSSQEDRQALDAHVFSLYKLDDEARRVIRDFREERLS